MALGSRARVALWTAAGASLLAAWTLHDYRLPREAQARTLNAGRSFEQRRRVDAHGIEQVWVPSGCFERGASLADDPRAHADETPRHTVCIGAGFWIDRFEVTNRSFDEFVRAGWYRERGRWPEPAWTVIREQQLPYEVGFPRNYLHPQQPRVKVTWYEAEAYARWRGGRLPTEAEWEWAARGPDSRRYPWGEEFDPRRANTDRPDRRCTVLVGGYPGGRSWVGAEDMSGNVAEWTADAYDPHAYRTAVRDDPFVPPAGRLMVLKGGAWGGITGGSPSDVRGARRLRWPADSHKTSHGWRIVSPGP